MDRERQTLDQKAVNILDEYRRRLIQEGLGEPEAVMDAVRDWFGGETDALTLLGELTGKQMDNAFRFLEEAFGQGQELVLFVTELTAGPDTSWFVEHYGCDAYFRHNQELLFDDTRQKLREEIEATKSEARQAPLLPKETRSIPAHSPEAAETATEQEVSL